MINRSLSISGHISVLLEETITALAVQPGGRYIDGTVGGGGHAAAILKHSVPGGQLLGIDVDPKAIEIARTRLAAYGDSVLLVNDNFANLQAICFKYDFFPVHGILLDLGLSSLQLEEEGRGFSFQRNAPLDMRYSPAQGVTAADIVNSFSEAELTNLLKGYGEEVHSRQIAAQIVRERPIRTTFELVRVIERAVGGRRGKLHPATKTFQALRIAVNRELKNLEAALAQAVELLGSEGRLVVISYHSLEDRIVKQFMLRESKDCICPPNIPTCVCRHVARLRLVNKKVVGPSLSEIERNPRSRSAKLRVAERVMPGALCAADEEPSFLLASGVGGWRRPALLKKIRMVYSLS